MLGSAVDKGGQTSKVQSVLQWGTHSKALLVVYSELMKGNNHVKLDSGFKLRAY